MYSHDQDVRKVKVLSLPETIKEKSTFRAKALRRELLVGGRGKPRVFLLLAMIAAKDMKCVSFSSLALSTLLALMNVLVTFNAHLLCLTRSLIDSPSFLFFTPILFCVFVSLPGIILCNTIYISLFTLYFDEIHLIGFYFVT